MKRKLVKCFDCGVNPGEEHQEGCDVERCSICGGQRLMCGCQEENDKQFSRWTGIWPGEAEAKYLGLDLNSFEKYDKIFFKKKEVM